MSYILSIIALFYLYPAKSRAPEPSIEIKRSLDFFCRGAAYFRFLYSKDNASRAQNEIKRSFDFFCRGAAYFRRLTAKIMQAERKTK
jgi:hypothetical protein